MIARRNPTQSQKTVTVASMTEIVEELRVKAATVATLLSDDSWHDPPTPKEFDNHTVRTIEKTKMFGLWPQMLRAFLVMPRRYRRHGSITNGAGFSIYHQCPARILLVVRLRDEETEEIRPSH